MDLEARLVPRRIERGDVEEREPRAVQGGVRPLDDDDVADGAGVELRRRRVEVEPGGEKRPPSPACGTGPVRKPRMRASDTTAFRRWTSTPVVVEPWPARPRRWAPRACPACPPAPLRTLVVLPAGAGGAIEAGVAGEARVPVSGGIRRRRPGGRRGTGRGSLDHFRSPPMCPEARRGPGSAGLPGSPRRAARRGSRAAPRAPPQVTVLPAGRIGGPIGSRTNSTVGADRYRREWSGRRHEGGGVGRPSLRHENPLGVTQVTSMTGGFGAGSGSPGHATAPPRRTPRRGERVHRAGRPHQRGPLCGLGTPPGRTGFIGAFAPQVQDSLDNPSSRVPPSRVTLTYSPHSPS